MVRGVGGCAQGVWGQQQQQQQQQEHGGVRGRSEAGPSARAPPYSSPNAHFASFRPPAGSSEQLALRPRLPGGYELNSAQPVYVPPWERAGYRLLLVFSLLSSSSFVSPCLPSPPPPDLGCLSSPPPPSHLVCSSPSPSVCAQ
eukprot:1963631-Rhodomonas_salina.2